MRAWLIEKRKQLKLSQQQVAEATYIDRSYYSQIESGKRTPSREIAERLANLLHFQSAAFFTEDTNQPFQFALQNIPMVLAHCNTNLEYTWIYNPHTDFEDQTIIGKPDDELDQNDGIRQLMQLKQEVLEKNKTIRRQIQFPLSTGLMTYWFFAEPLQAASGEVIGVVTAAIEVSEFEE